MSEHAVVSTLLTACTLTQDGRREDHSEHATDGGTAVAAHAIGPHQLCSSTSSTTSTSAASLIGIDDSDVANTILANAKPIIRIRVYICLVRALGWPLVREETGGGLSVLVSASSSFAVCSGNADAFKAVFYMLP